MTAAARAQVWLSPVVAISLVLVSAFSLLAFLVLSAYAPDLRSGSDGGAHALSTSAIGFAGIVRLLGDDGIPVVVDRGFLAKGREGASLMVLTPGAFGDPSKLVAVDPDGPRLIVLPKWDVALDPMARGWVRKIDTLDAGLIVDSTVKTLSASTKLSRRGGTAPVALHASSAAADFGIPSHVAAIDSLQTVSGKDWLPLVVDGHGGAVLARLRGTRTYVLADPDLMNTHGLYDLATARAAVAILQGLRANDSAIRFDVALNGFGNSPSLLREAFEPPFLGATLCAIVAAALMAFHTAARFGAPIRAAPAFAAGKQALVDNSAQLIKMLGREPRMTLRYAYTTRNIAARAVGAPKDLNSSDLTALLDRLTRTAGGAQVLQDLVDAAGRAETRTDMMGIAAKLYHWRRELTHGR
ncbi:MAG: hypothetical protein ABSA49_06020 [Rhizomicrobium sp.]|jgi:hypothetical protein